MSLRQDRLTFFGVLVAVVIAVLGYLQLGMMYPLEGRAEDEGASRGEEAEKREVEKTEEQNDHETDGERAARQDDAVR